MQNAILRCFLPGNIYMLNRAFLTYVRPLPWSPCYKQDSEAIILSEFSVDFPNVCQGSRTDLSYEERLKYLGWPNLELRALTH